MTKTKQEKQTTDIMQNSKLCLGFHITFRDPDIIKYNTGMVEFELASKYQVTKDFEYHYKSTKQKKKTKQKNTTRHNICFFFFFKDVLIPNSQYTGKQNLPSITNTTTNTLKY